MKIAMAECDHRQPRRCGCALLCPPVICFSKSDVHGSRRMACQRAPRVCRGELAVRAKMGSRGPLGVRSREHAASSRRPLRPKIHTVPNQPRHMLQRQAILLLFSTTLRLRRVRRPEEGHVLHGDTFPREVEPAARRHAVANEVMRSFW